MATGGGNQKGKRSNGTSKDAFAASVGITAAGLVGVALLYGAKKLYDYISTKKPPPKKLEDEDEDVEARRRRRRAELSQTGDNVSQEEVSLMQISNYSMGDPAIPSINIVSPLSESSFNSAASLHDSLLEYYTSYVDIPEIDQALALTVVEDVKESVHYILEELMPGIPITGMSNIGSSAEGLNVVLPDLYQVVLQLNLDPKLWELVDAGETLLGAHGYQMVKRTHLEFFSRGVTPYDKFLIGEYLSPQKVKTAFLDTTNRVNNWGSRFKIQSAVIGPSVKLFVMYGGKDGEQEDKTITVELIPGVRLDGSLVLATTHDGTHQLEKPGYANLWMHSFAEAEYKYLTAWKPPTSTSASPINTTVPKEIVDSVPNSHVDGPVAGCQLVCLKLLEAVRLNHPAQLGFLTAYCTRTIVMQLLDMEDSWHQEELSERFLDTLKALEEALRTHRLPHYFCPKLNLLQDLDPVTLDNARQFITAIVGNNQFPALLKTNY